MCTMKRLKADSRKQNTMVEEDVVFGGFALKEAPLLSKTSVCHSKLIYLDLQVKTPPEGPKVFKHQDYLGHILILLSHFNSQYFNSTQRCVQIYEIIYSWRAPGMPCYSFSPRISDTRFEIPLKKEISCVCPKLKERTAHFFTASKRHCHCGFLRAYGCKRE